VAQLIDLKHINYNKCPECGSPASSIGLETYAYQDDTPKKISQHTNGGRWEYIIFTCGRKDQYAPNFESIQTEYPCPQRSAAVLIKQKRKLATKHLIGVLDGLDVDDYFKETLEHEIKQKLHYTCLPKDKTE
jgi:DNA-directed RNA polymerase subunit RPC12/RpoP